MGPQRTCPWTSTALPSTSWDGVDGQLTTLPFDISCRRTSKFDLPCIFRKVSVRRRWCVGSIRDQPIQSLRPKQILGGLMTSPTSDTYDNHRSSLNLILFVLILQVSKANCYLEYSKSCLIRTTFQLTTPLKVRLLRSFCFHLLRVVKILIAWDSKKCLLVSLYIFPFNLTLTTDIFKVSDAGLVPLRMSLQNPSIPDQNNVKGNSPDQILQTLGWVGVYKTSSWTIIHTLRVYVICFPKQHLYLYIHIARSIAASSIQAFFDVEDQSHLNCHSFFNKQTRSLPLPKKWTNNSYCWSQKNRVTHQCHTTSETGVVWPGLIWSASSDVIWLVDASKKRLIFSLTKKHLKKNNI